MTSDVNLIALPRLPKRGVVSISSRTNEGRGAITQNESWMPEDRMRSVFSSGMPAAFTAGRLSNRTTYESLSPM